LTFIYLLIIISIIQKNPRSHFSHYNCVL